MSVQERMKREIFQSQCFDLLRKLNPEFFTQIDQKLEAVEGDIVCVIE